MGIGDFIRNRLAEGMLPEGILPLVRAKFPDARTTINSIRWYRTNPKNGQGKSRQRKSPLQPSIPEPRRHGSNSRYKSYAIGNAQNGVIRNILSNIGKTHLVKLTGMLQKRIF
jgi:hypothetical protein